MWCTASRRASETLAAGDLVSIDCGAILDGWHGDSAITFGIGALIPVDEALSQATRASMEAGIAAMVPGNRLTDVSHAIETGTHAAEERYDRKFGIVAGYGGHGIGRQMHMDPFLPNEGAPGPRAVPGAGFGAGHRADADPRHHQDGCSGGRMDRRHRRRVPRRALGAHRRRHRRRAAHPDPMSRRDRSLFWRIPVNRTTVNLVLMTEVDDWTIPRPRVMRVLYDEHAAALWRYAVRLTGDPARAEDVVQETLLRAWRHPEVTDDVSGPHGPGCSLSRAI